MGRSIPTAHFPPTNNQHRVPPPNPGDTCRLLLRLRARALLRAVGQRAREAVLGMAAGHGPLLVQEPSRWFVPASFALQARRQCARRELLHQAIVCRGRKYEWDKLRQ